MIEKITSPTFKTSDGEKFDKLSDAQQHELELIFPPLGDGGYAPHQIAILILQKAESVIDILSTTPRSKPKARKINGGTKTRKAKATTETAANLALK